MERQRCAARSKQTGEPCKRWAIEGGTTCRFHGGAAPQVLAAAARRVAQAEVVAELDRLGVAIEVDPAEALLQMVYEAAGNVAVLRMQVAELELGVGPEAIAGLTGNERKRNEAGPHVLVAMYDAERERLARWSKMAIDAGIEERRVRIAERDTERLFTAVQRALVTIGDEEVREAFVQALAGELRAGASVPLGA